MRSSVVVLGKAKFARAQADVYNELFFAMPTKRAAVFPEAYVEMFEWEWKTERRQRRRVLARLWASHGPVPAWLRYSS